MPSEYSIYSIHQAEKPKWMPIEEHAAVAFIAMTFLLVVEINVEIHRVFKQRKGVYFWAMQLGSIGCAADALGLILKYLVPTAVHVYPVYTLLTGVGWAVYTVAQLTVLYSRLHLVSQNHSVQRGVFYMIVVISPILIVTDWIITWPAWNPDPKITDKWSAPDAIVERICQLGFSIVEVIINAIYALALVKILKIKSSVRQRRVMLDLTYVNVLAIALDILNIILVYINRVGVSHPIQTFSYTLKLRLEFVVLNQLMAVAARGLHRETFAEKRYHHPGSVDGSTSFHHGLEEQEQDIFPGNLGTRDGSAQISAPSRLILKPQHSSIGQSTTASSFQPNRSPKEEGRGREWISSIMKTTLSSLVPHNSHARRASDEHEIMPGQAKRRKPVPQRKLEHGSEEDELDMYMWERGAKSGLEVPWFHQSSVGV